MSRYGIPSRKMLVFLNENPGSTAREIHDHLHGDRTVTQVRIHYKFNSWTQNGRVWKVCTQWQSKRFVIDCMMSSDYYCDIEILAEREQLVSKISRGKFAYLTSPYCSRTLSADFVGSRPHSGAANRGGQRCWFHRTRHDDVYIYWLTLRGMAALREYGIKAAV